MMDPANYPPRPRLYRGRRRRPNLLHRAIDAALNAMVAFAEGVGIWARGTESPHRGYGGGVKRAAGAPAPRDEDGTR